MRAQEQEHIASRSPTGGMRVQKERPRCNFLWNCLTYGAWGIALLPLISPGSFDPHAYRSSLFVDWEGSKPRHPVLLDAIKSSFDFGPEPEGFWMPPDKGFRPCPISSSSTLPLSREIATEGYLQVFLEGGLNQQRMGICDAVAVAKILNVTLVLPHFDYNPVWQDSSTFSDIFDVDHFLMSLESDVHIVTELPSEFEWSTREYYGTGWRETRIKDAPTHAAPSWYQSRVLSVIREHGIAAIAPFTHRLVFDDLPEAIQKLRCRVNFEALRFKPGLESLGDLIVERLHGIAPWKIASAGGDDASGLDLEDRDHLEFLTLHLRFDKDMAAHSACDFGGGRAEKLALAKYSRQHWRGGVSNQLDSIDKVRELGKCPLTPEEVGIVMAGLGFRPRTLVYLASHQVYGGEERMKHLRTLFPFTLDKYSLTTDAEIDPFRGKASQLAALDYHVSLHSNAFISASRGNMHNALVGHRAYGIDGLTIRLDMILIAQLFKNSSISWPDFQESLQAGHANRKGKLSMRKKSQSIYTYPAPDCMCAIK